MLFGTENGDLVYWIFEYGKVFCGYFLLMFLWPSVVFAGHLRKKAKTYRFAFCITVTVVIINTVVLSLGLFHHLDRRTIRMVFYGTFIVFSVIDIIVWIYRQYRKRRGADSGISDDAPFIDQPEDRTDELQLAEQPENRIKEFKRQGSIITWVKRGIQHWIWPFLEKYSALIVVLVWGMIYFSYGAFQIHSYGYGDLYVHHEWIYGLIEGNAFSGGVYPEGMHCFIYCMHMLFDIRVYSILLFLQGIHAAVFLIAAYCLLRKVFHWRHTPLFVLALFLTVDLSNGDLIHSMFRLQITMPLEFGLPMVCLCALYLTNYLNTDRVKANGKRPLLYLDSNLLLFSMALAAALTIHFHVLIMTFIICFSFALFALHKVLNLRRLIPLAVSVVCACVVAALPMAGALKQGVPFHESINWALNAMSGEQSREMREQLDETDGEKGEEEKAEKEEEEEAQDIKLKGITAVTDIRDTLQEVYENGYTPLYGAVRARWIAVVTLLGVLLCVVFWLPGRYVPRFQYMGKVCSGYPPVILASFLYAVVYAAPMLGLPDIIPEGRFFAPGHMMLLAVMAIPFDILVSLLMCFCHRVILWGLSCLSIAGVYGAAVQTGSLRGYLYYEMTRYNSVVEVTNSIIDTFPQHSYTLISPTDELFQIVQYGWHEELLSFVEKCNSEEEYTLPSEYVFIYVEKKPILYAQSHFFEGPSWLAKEKYLAPYWEMYSLRYIDSGASQSPAITATRVSEEEAEKDLPYEYTLWDMYLKLDGRTILESKAYDACRQLAERYPSVFKVYYEDDDFVCYYFKQDASEGLCNMGKEEVKESKESKEGD